MHLSRRFENRSIRKARNCCVLIHKEASWVIIWTDWEDGDDWRQRGCRHCRCISIELGQHFGQNRSVPAQLKTCHNQRLKHPIRYRTVSGKGEILITVCFVRHTLYKSSCLLAVKVTFCSLRVLKDLLCVGYDEFTHIAAFSFGLALAITFILCDLLVTFLLLRGFLFDLIGLSLDFWLQCFAVLVRFAFGLGVRIASAFANTVRNLTLLWMLQEVFVDHRLDWLKLEENVLFSSLRRL